eukprot:scaffold17930_cov135-Isochrysis_galbana.AAC.2
MAFRAHGVLNVAPVECPRRPAAVSVGPDAEECHAHWPLCTRGPRLDFGRIRPSCGTRGGTPPSLNLLLITPLFLYFVSKVGR